MTFLLAQALLACQPQVNPALAQSDSDGSTAAMPSAVVEVAFTTEGSVCVTANPTPLADTSCCPTGFTAVGISGRAAYSTSSSIVWHVVCLQDRP